jgi:hypothetical protein
MLYCGRRLYSANALVISTDSVVIQLQTARTGPSRRSLAKIFAPIGMIFFTLILSQVSRPNSKNVCFRLGLVGGTFAVMCKPIMHDVQCFIGFA